MKEATMAKVTIEDNDNTILFKKRIKYNELPDLLKELEEKFR
jgi:hypothetical protein